MDNNGKFDGFLNSALILLGTAAGWGVVYFIVLRVSTQIYAPFPIALLSVISALALITAAVFSTRGVPHDDGDPEPRIPAKWDEARKDSFRKNYVRNTKRAKILMLVGFGLLIPTAIDILLLLL